jgi:uncharacterized protein YndB with AHSA1/START domain
MRNKTYGYWGGDTKVISFQNQVEIDRSVEHVFSYVSDLENIPDWNYAIGKTKKVTPGPAGVGTIYRQRREIPSPSEEQLEIVEVSPNEKLVIEGELGPFRARMVYEFAPRGHSTHLRNDVELTAMGASKLVAPLVGGQIRKAVAKNLKELRARLES